MEEALNMMKEIHKESRKTLERNLKASMALNKAAEIEALTDGINTVDRVYGTVIAALEKQIPKKPVFEPGSDEILQCQGCGADLAWTSSLKPKYRAAYCEKCGQAIDWSEWE